jgi:D-psicose/D-tagatose/L-ribulose 3-epimerase
MRFGMNLLLWTDTLHDGILPLLDEIKGIGYDAVEIPVFELDADKYAQWGKHLDNAGLARTGVTVRGGDDNPISPDAEVRNKGVENNKLAVECCQAAGCESLVGPFHSALGEFSGKGPTDDEWQRGVESAQKLSEHAEKCQVKLGFEYLNRFECYFLNTAADGARFCSDVNHPYCRMMYDTFHSHIEEKNTPAAIRALKDYLVHVHISENDRSTPGQGNIRWAENYDTLKEIGYDNIMVVEAFGLALEKLVPATKIWRRMYESERQLATDALSFMKAEVAKRW